MNQESKLLKIVGTRVRDLRKKKGYSQETFAELCNLHRTYIGAIERGERNITLQSLEAISCALEVEPQELLQDV